jgi:protein tyrosine/serine phosphatase
LLSDATTGIWRCNFEQDIALLKQLINPKKRQRRRAASLKRWNRPVDTFRRWIRAWINMVLVDHGIFRLFYLNRHRVTPQFWRAAQPTPGQIRQAARDGVRTIINLRGGREFGSWPLERDICEKLDLKLVDFTIRSRGAPDRERIASAAKFFESLEYPVLAHCKSGADRAGFMSTLFLLVHEKRPLDEAMRQLSAWYGHFKFAKTGILDEFFEQYRRTGLEKGIDFQTWIEKIYDPVALERDFKPNRIADWLVDRVLRRE